MVGTEGFHQGLQPVDRHAVGGRYGHGFGLPVWLQKAHARADRIKPCGDGGEQVAARRCQFQRVVLADEKRQLLCLFKDADLLADRTLGDVQLFRRKREAQAFGGDLEGGQRPSEAAACGEPVSSIGPCLPFLLRGASASGRWARIASTRLPRCWQQTSGPPCSTSGARSHG